MEYTTRELLLHYVGPREGVLKLAPVPTAAGLLILMDFWGWHWAKKLSLVGETLHYTTLCRPSFPIMTDIRFYGSSIAMRCGPVPGCTSYPRL